MADWFARLPRNGAGLLATQLQESPPSEPGEAPAGRASSTQTILGELTVMLVRAKTRRPSGSCASASIEIAPLLLGVSTSGWPKAGSWPCTSQATRAPLRSTPGAETLSDTGVPVGTTPLGAEMVPATECHA